jgi:cellulose synthase/poly-beta-1,6-N-acetylglucosamine synthase-like glycosyltransferase
MTTIWVVLLLGCATVLAYVLVGYPLLLRLVVRARGPRPILKRDITPPVSLVISAYNEADVIAQKIENALALDYPPDSLEIVVISDASDDDTDDVVRGYASRGVQLRRQAERRGKTAGLNAVVPYLTGEIVVFSDANAMYETDAVRKLVRSFADTTVGCVTGEARYVNEAQGAADEGEGAYWNYEIQVKRLETATGSCVGGDGAIYAIRRHLWQRLPEDGINDFLNPLQIVAAGWRGVYEPEAVCYESTAGETAKEYRRRVRIISRSWRAVFLVADVLKPWKVGFFALSVISHKVLRWWSGVFVLGMFTGAMGLLVPTLVAAPPWVWAVLAVGVMAAMAVPPVRQVLQVAWYFGVLNVASLVGLFKGSVGRVSGVWTTPRQATERSAQDIVDLWTGSALVTMALLLAWLGVMLEAHSDAVRVLFWASLGMLIYLFVGYPLLLVVARTLRNRALRQGTAARPSVCILVAAHDEEDVIEGKVQNSLAVDYPRELLQVVVASDGSTDRTNAIVRRFEADGVRLFAYPMRRGKIATINATVPHITQDVIVFTDANAFLRPEAVSALVRNFSHPTVGAVSGDVVLTGERAALATSEDLYYSYERWLQRVESELGSMVGVDGALYAIRRELFESPLPDTVLDDMAVPMAVIRRGYRVVFDMEAIAFEHGARSAWEEFARKTRIVAGAVQFLKRGRREIPWRAPQAVFSLLSHKVLRWLSPLIGALFLVSCFALRHEGVVYSTIWWATVVTLGLGVLGCSQQLRRLLPIGVCYYFCMVHLAAATGMIRGLIGGQAVAWQRFPRTPVSPV